MKPATVKVALGAVLIGAGGIAPAFAQMESEAWKFEATPYLFAAGLRGVAGVRGVTMDLDVPFSDIAKQIDSAFEGMLEARKGKWIFGLDMLYMKLSGDEAKSWNAPLGTGSAKLDVTVSQYLYQVSAGHRVVDERTKVDLLGGVRYTRLDVDVTLGVSAPLLPDGSRTATGHESWYDGVVGARVLQPLGERWTAVGYLDYGIVGGSDKTYQAYAGVNWHFSRNLTAKLGYRYLYADYTHNGFTWDMASYGVQVGLGIGF